MTLLEAKGLEVEFETPEGVVRAVNGVDFSLKAGEVLAIVGESGSGKSQLVMSMMGLLAENGRARGSACFQGQELMGMKPSELNRIRGSKAAMIFQDPKTSLNPYLDIRTQMTEVLRRHRGMNREEARAKAVEMLSAVRIPDAEERIRQYPHEYSGGMQQRVMIAMGLLCEPDLLIADEPTTALDVTVQAQIMQLVRELSDKTNMAIIMITHDLAVVAEIADRIMVMYAGEVVETGTAEQIFYDPRHPYTQGLLASVPRLDRLDTDELHAIPGNPPNLLELPEGCRFRDRCSHASMACEEPPPVWQTADGRICRCVMLMEDAEIQTAPAAGSAEENE